MYQRISGSLVYGAADTDKSLSWESSGMNTRAVVLCVDVPNFTNAVTVTIRYKSDGGRTMKAVAAIPKNAPYPIALDLPMIDGGIIQGIISGVPGGSGGTITLDLYIASEGD